MDRDQALAKIAARCRWDLFYLARYILGYDLMEEAVHGELCKYVEALLPTHPPEYVSPAGVEGKGLEDQFSPGNQSLLLLMPRGTFKSSVVTIGFSLQFILNEPNARILIDSETYGKAKAFLMEIKGHLETNNAYRDVFKSIHGMYPDQGKKKEMVWTDSQINIACRTRPLKEPTFSVAGIDKAINGMHYDLIIMDDLHSEKNVTNKEQIQQVIDHWKLAYSLIDPGKPIIVIGTRWDYNDLYQEILDNHREEFNILIRRAIKEDGTAFFPNRLPLEELERIKQKQGSSHFSNQYLNEPISDTDATFKRENIIRREWNMVKDRPINWYMSVDPSYGGEYSDFAALVVAGMDFQRDIYVRHILRKKMTYSEIIDAIFELNSKFNPRTILIETIASAKSIMYELNNEQRRRGAWLRLQEIKKQPKSKEERIRGLATFYEYGHIFHIKECPNLDELEYELLHFPRGKHDDMIDALANILEVATPPSANAPTTKEDKEDRSRLPFKPRSFITGY